MGAHLVHHRASVTGANKLSLNGVWLLLGIAGVLSILTGITACSAPKESRPTVIIMSPPSGSTWREGESVDVQSTSMDDVGVVRVELVIDNVVSHTDSVPSATGPITLTQSWRATPGRHVILVRAYNTLGNVSSPAAVAVTVAQTTTPTATVSPALVIPLASPTATGAVCADNAVFVSDITVPDGTPWAPGQAFNKIWRVRNTGCPWGAGYELVFVSGEAMSTTRVIPLPVTPQSGTADLLVPMIAPSIPGAHSGTWRLRNPGGKVFGTSVIAKIAVLGASASSNPTKTTAPTACSGTPSISSFTASQRIVPVFGSTVLSWGPVTNADSVEIDQNIGPIGAPGSLTVTPGGTTVYTMTAHCGSETATAQVRILLPFAVTGSVASADPSNTSGACPRVINFSGTVTVTDAGTVTYKWESSDGSNDSPVGKLTFDGAGSQTVTHTWTLGSGGKTYTDYWERLHVLSPTDVTSNNATFTLGCN